MSVDYRNRLHTAYIVSFVPCEQRFPAAYIQLLLQIRDPLTLYGAINSGTVDLYALGPSRSLRRAEGSLFSVWLQEGRERFPTCNARQHVCNRLFLALGSHVTAVFAFAFPCCPRRTERSHLPRVMSPRRFYAMQTVRLRAAISLVPSRCGDTSCCAATEVGDGTADAFDPIDSNAPLRDRRTGKDWPHPCVHLTG